MPVPSALPPFRRGALRRRGATALSVRRRARGGLPLPTRALADGRQRDASDRQVQGARRSAPRVVGPDAPRGAPPFLPSPPPGRGPDRRSVIPLREPPGGLARPLALPRLLLHGLLSPGVRVPRGQQGPGAREVGVGRALDTRFRDVRREAAALGNVRR